MTMISRGVEISIAGGGGEMVRVGGEMVRVGGETVRVLSLGYFSFFFFFFFFL